jgi:hypothetical protein
MKRLIGSDLGSYAFDPGAKTVTLAGLPDLSLDQILLVTDVSAGRLLYSFADPALGGSLADNILTLATDTADLAAGDALQIWVDIPAPAAVAGEGQGLEPVYTYDTNLAQVFGSQPLASEGWLRTISTPSGIISRKYGVLKNINDEARIDCQGANTVALQITGGGGNINFYGSINGVNEFLAYASPLGVAASGPVCATSGPGTFSLNCSGYAYIRAVNNVVLTAPAYVTLIADAGVGPSFSSVSQPTSDTQIPTVLGATQLFAPGIDEATLVGVRGAVAVNPATSPTQPTAYAEPKFAQYPQRYRRLRVEAGGSERRALAQEPYTDRLLVSWPELYARVEELLAQQTLTNKLLAQAFGLALPSGMPDTLN